MGPHLRLSTGADGPTRSLLLQPRQTIEGITFGTGIAWHELPKTVGKWQIMWTWHRRIAFDNTGDVFHSALTAHAARNNKVGFTVSVDYTIAHAYRNVTNNSRV